MREVDIRTQFYRVSDVTKTNHRTSSFTNWVPAKVWFGGAPPPFRGIPFEFNRTFRTAVRLHS